MDNLWLMRHRQQEASDLCKCLAIGSNPWVQQFWPCPCQEAHHQLPRWAWGGLNLKLSFPMQQCPPSISQALRGCRTSLGKELHPRKLCSFLISYWACCEVANPCSLPPCPDQCFAVPGCPGPAAAGDSATPPAACGETIPPSARAARFC